MRALVFAGLWLAISAGALSAQTQESLPGATAGSVAKAVGTVKAISGSTITLATDAGATVNVVIQESARLVRVAPGQKDLKDATPVKLQELQVGDRVLARGASADGGQSVVATSVVVMKESDVSAKEEHEREDWQKRGVGGLVSKVDASNKTVTLAAPVLTDAKPVTIRVSEKTIVRRYSPDSVKFDDARPGTLDQISPGDQLRARGVRSADGTELAAEEIVSGSFRNVAGTVISTDAANNTVSVLDLATKKPVTLRITADSQLRKLPSMFAQRIAQRLRGKSPDAASETPTPAAGGLGASRGGQGMGQSGAGPRQGGPPDFQQMLKRMPAATLADLQKGDAIMVVTTQGTATTQPTAITLLSGVEPILSASPDNSRAAMLLSPWNLGGGGDSAASAQ
jgi:hypothetical protein